MTRRSPVRSARERASRGYYLVASVGALIVGAGVAVGQPGVPPAPPPADAPLTQQVNISPADQLKQSDDFLVHMEQIRSTVRRQLQDAREKKDLVKQLCLNDKLSQVDTAIKTANDRHDDLAAAVKTSDAGQATYEYTILTTLKQRGDRRLQAEANQCLGEEIGRGRRQGLGARRQCRACPRKTLRIIRRFGRLRSSRAARAASSRPIRSLGSDGVQAHPKSKLIRSSSSSERARCGSFDERVSGSPRLVKGRRAMVE